MAATRIHELFDGWLQRRPDRVFLHLQAPTASPPP